MLKFSVCNALYCAEVIEYRPVAESYTAPIALAYLLNAWLAMYRRLVPVSTMPAVVDEMEVEPFVIPWSMPQYSEAGKVQVMGLKRWHYCQCCKLLNCVEVPKLTCR